MNQSTPSLDRSRGRGYLWAGIGLCVLGIGLMMGQFALGLLFVPWQMPLLATLGAILVVVSVARRPTVVRILSLVLVTLLAGLEWFFLTSLTSLDDYRGPARAGQPFPAFQTTLAGGQSFTERNLADGTASVMVFFRGRW